MIEQIKIFLYWNIPSKKNSKIWTWRYLLSSKKYREWEEYHLQQILWINRIFREEQWLKIECIFYRWDKRKFDLSNSFESIADLFVKASIIQDDNMTILSDISLKFWWYDKENPRCEILITKI